MTMHEHDFDRQMRDKFDSYRPDVSTGLWDKIAAQLDEQAGADKPAIAMPAARKRLGGWWMSAAAVLLLGAFAWWLYEPVEVVYLHGTAALVEETKPAQAPAEATQEEAAPAEAHVEPLNLAPIRALFAERARRQPNGQTATPEPNVQLQDELLAQVPAADPETRQEPELASTNNPGQQAVAVVAGENPVADTQPSEAYASVAEPSVVLADFGADEPAELQGENAFGVSHILNMVVGSVDPREEKLVTFSNDDEGLIKMAFNLGLGKDRKRNP